MTDQTRRRVLATLDFTELPRKGTHHLQALLRRARGARDYRHLASLPDYLLEDIGVARDQAETLARRGAWDLLSPSRHAG